MKTIKSIFLLAGIILISLASCKKDPGFGGKTNIKGTVTKGGAAISGAIVYLAIDAKEPTAAFNTSTVSDSTGKYSFSSLHKGDYFVDAEYIDENGTKFISAGAKVFIGGKKGDATVDLTVE